MVERRIPVQHSEENPSRIRVRRLALGAALTAAVWLGANSIGEKGEDTELAPAPTHVDQVEGAIIDRVPEGGSVWGVLKKYKEENPNASVYSANDVLLVDRDGNLEPIEDFGRIQPDQRVLIGIDDQHAEPDVAPPAADQG